jgi:hypothetical protein
LTGSILVGERCHDAALAEVNRVKAIAYNYDRSSVWCGFGTARVKDYDTPGLLQRLGLMPPVDGGTTSEK